MQLVNGGIEKSHLRSASRGALFLSGLGQGKPSLVDLNAEVADVVDPLLVA